MVYIKPREYGSKEFDTSRKYLLVQTLTCFCDETRHSMTVMAAWLTELTDAMSDRFEMLWRYHLPYEVE